MKIVIIKFTISKPLNVNYEYITRFVHNIIPKLELFILIHKEREIYIYRIYNNEKLKCYKIYKIYLLIVLFIKTFFINNINKYY